jgi:hypothetical protein
MYLTRVRDVWEAMYMSLYPIRRQRRKLMHHLHMLRTFGTWN